MKRGETVRIISDLYGDAGKTGTVYDVAEEECWRIMIRCKCGGIALHAMFHLDEEYEPPVFITEHMSYFKNDPKEDCGQPIVR